MLNISGSLEKIRYHQRYDKITSLSKYLRYKLATSETINSFDVFINLEKILRTLETDYLEGKIFNSEEIQTLHGLLASFEKLVIPENEFSAQYLLDDKILNLIKINFMIGNKEAVISHSKNIFENVFTVDYIQKKFLYHTKYTWRLVAEVAIATASVFLKNETQLTPAFVLRILNISIDSLFTLIKAQEQIIYRKVKTSPTLYTELLNLLLISTIIRVKISTRHCYFSNKIILNHKMILQEIDFGQFDKFRYLVPFNKISIAFCLAKWFFFDKEEENQLILVDLNSLQSTTSSISTSAYTEIITICNDVLNIFPISKITPQILRDNKSPEKYTITFCLNILTILLCQTSQFDVAASIIMKYLTLYFEESSRYFLLSCILFSAGFYPHSLELCKRAYELNPNDQNIISLLTNMLINTFKNYDEVIELSTKCLKQSSSDPAFLLSRSVAYLEKSFESVSMSETQETLNLAKTDLLKALELDDNDHEIYFYTGLTFIMLDDPETAFMYAYQATKRSLFDPRPYRLLFLVLVYRKMYDEAIQVLNDCEKEFPHDFGFLFNKINFEHFYFGPEVALKTAKKVMELWQSLYSISIHNNESIHALGSRGSSGRRYTSIDPESLISEKHLTNEHLVVIEGVCLPGNGPKIILSTPQDIKDAYLFLTILWSKIAELNFALNNINEIQRCLNELLGFGISSPQLFLVKAMFHSAKGQKSQTRECLETALFLEPNYIQALFQYVHFCLEQITALPNHSETNHSRNDDLILAEQLARHLVKIDSKNFKSWQCLGKILYEAKKYDESAYCLKRALERESFSSIIPFKTIFRRYRPSDTKSNQLSIHK